MATYSIKSKSIDLIDSPTSFNSITKPRTAEIIVALKEVTEPYELGLQLDIDTAELKTIENDYRGKTNRQKTEVIEYWLNNSPNPSWTTLASAVEKMGGHPRLAKELREKEQRNEISSKPQEFSHEATSESEKLIMTRSYSESLNTAVQREFSSLVVWAMASQHWEIDF